MSEMVDMGRPPEIFDIIHARMSSIKIFHSDTACLPGGEKRLSPPKMPPRMSPGKEQHLLLSSPPGPGNLPSGDGPPDCEKLDTELHDAPRRGTSATNELVGDE